MLPSHHLSYNKYSIYSQRVVLAWIWVSVLIRNDEVMSELFRSSQWMSNAMFKALCQIIDAIWLLPVWFNVYERSAVKLTCRKGDGTSILKECEIFNVVDAQDRQSSERLIQLLQYFKNKQLNIFFLQCEIFLASLLGCFSACWQYLHAA